MVVVDRISEQPFPMALMHRDEVVQQISPTAFHPALRYTIGMSIQLRRMAMLKLEVSE